MQYIVEHLDDIKDPVDRMYMALHALHPFRLEEVLGLQGEDIDLENRIIHIQRAVTHPDRNRPEVKETKTESSNRTLPIVPLALPYLLTVPDGQFLIGGEQPISYTQVRHMRERIKKDIAFDEDITPIRFRTTVLSDLYDQTKDIKLTQAAAGHTTSAMTLKYYVNQRAAAAETAAAIERAYAPKVADQLQDPESQTP
jgi:integrase